MRWTTFAVLPPLAAACAAPSGPGDLHMRELTAATGASLRGVCAVSNQIAWVSGSDGTCLRTLDGGATWLPCAPEGAQGRDLRDVHAFDALHAVVMAVGSPALLWHTRDGGATWREAWSDDRPAAFLDGIDFIDAARGFAFGDPIDGRFVTLRTTDGGATWRPTAPAPAPQAGEAAFAASGTCVSVLSGGDVLVATGGGEVARVLRATDLGARWHPHTTPLRSGAPSRGAFSLAVHGARAVAVGGDYRAPEDAFGCVAVSDDGGRTWRLPSGAPPRGYRSAVAFVPGTAGRVAIAAGPSGIDISHDRGESWQAFADLGLHALSFARDGSGYGTGAGGRIVRIEE